MVDDSLYPESTPQPENVPALLVIRDVRVEPSYPIQVRRINGLGEIVWTRVFDNNNKILLGPSDRIILEGNSFCVVYHLQLGNPEEAVAQIQSVRIQPAAPVWTPDGQPDPSPVDSRFIALQSPPVVDVHDLVLDGIAVKEVFVSGGMFQIEV